MLVGSKRAAAADSGGKGEESVTSNGEELCVNDRIHIWYGRGKTLRTYEAKVRQCMHHFVQVMNILVRF